MRASGKPKSPVGTFVKPGHPTYYMLSSVAIPGPQVVGDGFEASLQRGREILAQRRRREPRRAKRSKGK